MFEFLLRGGPVMIPIGLASIIALAVFIERTWYLRSSRVLPREARVELLEVSRQGRWSDAITLCRKSDSPMSRVLEIGFMNQGGSRERLKTLMEEVGLREAAELERYSVQLDGGLGPDPRHVRVRQLIMSYETTP